MSQSATKYTGKRLLIDPVTRIEGHLKIEVEIENAKVKNAWSSAQLFRGLETILKGRPPEDAPVFTQRVCGVCTNTHALTIIRAIEDALKLKISPLAILIRHLILATLIVHDHLVHFYHLHGFDWIDMASARQADPSKAGKILGQMSHRGDNPADLYIVQKKIKDFVNMGQLGFLENAYFLGGNPAYRLSQEENLILSAHYFEGLRVQLELGRAMALFAGKNPYFSSGVLWGNDLTAVDQLNLDEITEHVAKSWYTGDLARTPYEGETDPQYTHYDDKEKYSWSKAPRYKGEPMETGPLARRAIAYARKEKETRTLLDDFFKRAGMTSQDLFSTMGRTVCRVVETLMLVRKMKHWIDEAERRINAGDNTIHTPWQMPDSAQGVGTCCVTRGGLSHWIRIKNKKIENFQMVVPSTWNLGPRCANGKIGPVEQSLIGCPCPDPDRPVEILRTVHSFDPCIACAVHVIDNRGQP
nr:nickel-dependent hydrogenase large subunit [uncultured Desulfobacter sp.]